MRQNFSSQNPWGGEMTFIWPSLSICGFDFIMYFVQQKLSSFVYCVSANLFYPSNICTAFCISTNLLSTKHTTVAQDFRKVYNTDYDYDGYTCVIMFVMPTKLSRGERKSLDGLNTIIYETIHSDDTVICVTIMSLIIIVNEKDFILNLCKLLIWLWKAPNGLINGPPPSMTQNNCLLVIRFMGEFSPRSANNGLRFVTKLQDERG